MTGCLLYISRGVVVRDFFFLPGKLACQLGCWELVKRIDPNPRLTHSIHRALAHKLGMYTRPGFQICINLASLLNSGKLGRLIATTYALVSDGDQTICTSA
jgi:hypothetical protein